MEKLSERSFRHQYGALWQKVFSDPKPFVKMFLPRHFERGEAFGVKLHHRLIAGTYCKPYLMKVGEATAEVSYLCGLATAGRYRRRGWAAKVVEEALRTLKAEGRLLVTLIPSNERNRRYYGNHFAFANCFHYTDRYITPEGEPTFGQMAQTTLLSEEWLQFIEKELKGRKCGLLHSREQLMTVMKSIQMDGGGLYGLRREGNLQAVAVVEQRGTTLRVSELMGEPENGLELLRHVARHRGKNAPLLLRDFTTNEKTGGMARVLDLPRLAGLCAQALPERKLRFRVSGDHLFDNHNTTYALDHGRCLVGGPTEDCDLVVTPAQATELLLEPLHPILSLMVD